ncbi:DUF4932 domain-containing protein, partial [Spirosoma sp.]|uniref:DUF4932 domain-containing protein n=1 Tax=Spirosoma sp. TaxID=1899569 RepID=UPI003B3AA210
MRATFLIGLILVSVLGQRVALAQDKLPVLRTNGKLLSIRVGNEYRAQSWGIDPNTRPDKFEVTVKEKPVRVAFIAENDSLVREVKRNDVIDFVVLTPAGDSAFTQIYGWPYVEPAIFSDTYRKENKGKTFVEIPETYELINIAFALTKATQQKESDLIEKDTPYYKELMAYFTPYSHEPIITILDSVLTKNQSDYFPLKMDAYSFLIDRQGTIRQSPVYDRTAWGKENSLRPYMGQLQQFARKSKFVDFYRRHQPYYNRLINSYRDSLDVAGMQT